MEELETGQIFLVTVHPIPLSGKSKSYRHFNLLAVLVYVAYRCINPDTATLDEVKKDLKDNDIDGSQLVPWSAEHCEQ
jgi:hypothetical protein